MRIGIDGRLWNETGVGRYIRSLVGELGKLRSRHSFVIFLRQRDYETVTMPTSQFEKKLADVSWHTIAEQLLMPKIYRKAKVDLVHFPYFSVPLFTPQPFVVTIHDLTISNFATGKATTKPFPFYLIKRLGYKFILLQAVKRAVNIITVSETIKKQILDEFLINPDKVCVTYESGEIEEFNRSPQPIDYLRERVKSPYLLYVGNAHPHKNLDLLVEALPELLKLFPKLKLALLGRHDYFYNKLIRKIDYKSLTNNVFFPGEVSNSELIRWYKNAAAYVFPSLSEGFGIPGLEAMQHECPVIASDISVFHEIYGEAALYFNPREKTDLVSKLTELLLDKSLRQRLVNSGNLKAAEYSWQKMARETLAIYENRTRI